MGAGCGVPGSEDYDLGSGREVVVVVAGTADVKVDAAVRGRVKAAAVEGDPAGSEEHGVRNRDVVLGADVVRSGPPLDVEGAARGCLLRAGRPRLHGHRAVGYAAVGLQPGEVGVEVLGGGVVGVGVLAATASGVGRGPGEDTPIAAARTFACSASGSCLTRD